MSSMSAANNRCSQINNSTMDTIRWIDLSHPIDGDTPVFPGDPPIEIEILDSTSEPDRAGERHLNCSRIAICVHNGTHLDAPFHFFAQGRTIDQVPLGQCNGPATSIKLPLLAADTMIQPLDLQPWEASIRRTRRLLLNSGWYRRWKVEGYFQNHPVLSGETARWLLGCGVELIGVDFPSVDHPPFEAHLEILGAGALILENLTNLDLLPHAGFEIATLPLALVGRDGSPVRVAARLEPS